MSTTRDLIGTHWRYQQARSLTDWMAERGQGRHQPEPRPRRLHRHVVHHRAGRRALPAARPAVREPLLVPLRLVQRREEQGRLQGEVRLRPRRAGQLVGLRGHRRVLHRPRDRRQEGLWPHGLRQEGPVARLALHRRLAVDGRQRRQGHSERPAGRRMGHQGRREVAAGRLLRRARRRHQRPGGGLFDPEVPRLAEGLRAAGSPGHDLLRIRSGAVAGRGRPADVHLHGLHRRLRQGRACRS